MDAGADERLLVFTDLDGTLLDHDDYGWGPAEGVLGRLAAAGSPVVLCSSKTLAEMVPLARKIGTGAPLVAENGSVVAVPEGGEFKVGAGFDRGHDGYVFRIEGVVRDAIVRWAHGLRDERGYRFAGFADWSAAEVAERTGLAEDAAAKAGRRLATEPILWDDSEARWDEFAAELATHGVRTVHGGRFIHLMGEVDKSDGLRAVLGLYPGGAGAAGSRRTVALGDSENDLAMLRAADTAIAVPRADGSVLPHLPPGASVAPLPGPAGWAAAMSELLDGRCSAAGAPPPADG